MKKTLLVTVLSLILAPASFSQQKPILVVQEVTSAPSVSLPYDLKQLRDQLVAEFKVSLGKEFDVAAEAPSTAQGAVYALKIQITEWHPGNAAKRIFVGLGSGRESANIEYQVTDGSGKKVVEKKDTIRTNFYSQGAGSTGTLGHPFAQKISQRIKDAKLK